MLVNVNRCSHHRT